MANHKREPARTPEKSKRKARVKMHPVTAQVPDAVFENLEAERARLAALLGSDVSMATAVRSALTQWSAQL